MITKIVLGILVLCIVLLVTWILGIKEDIKYLENMLKIKSDYFQDIHNANTKFYNKTILELVDTIDLHAKHIIKIEDTILKNNSKQKVE